MSTETKTICDICGKEMNEHSKIWGFVFSISYTYGVNDGGSCPHPEDGHVKYNAHMKCVSKAEIFGKGKLPIPRGLD